MYDIPNERLRHSVEKHSHVALTELHAELSLLRGMIEQVIAEAQTSTEALQRLEGPVNSVFKIATKLREIEIAQGDLLTRATVAEVGKRIIEQFNQVMNEYLDNDTRNLIVDEWKRRVGGAVLEYRPDDDSSN